MNILITNAVPSNSGDEALLLSLIYGIKKIHPNANFTVLCNDAENVKTHIKYVNIDWDWEYGFNLDMFSNNKSYKDKFKLKIRLKLEKYGFPFYKRISTILALGQEKRILKLYKNADFVISSAGGYLHDIYGYDKRLIAFRIALENKKKILIFGQSIGPFFPKNISQHNELKYVFSKSKHIFLREKISKLHLENIGYHNDNVTITTDIAFSLHGHLNLFKIKTKRTKKIAVSFRKWEYKKDSEFVVNQGFEIIKFLINNDFNVTFLSTCQGLNHYVDDSEIAISIKQMLPNHMKNSFDIDRNHYSIPKLIEKYSEFDFYIGMRLHGAILAMLGGTPAFNLGYEDKTLGIFGEIGLSNFQCNFDDNIELIIERIEFFLINNKNINLKKIIEDASKTASLNFEIFK